MRAAALFIILVLGCSPDHRNQYCELARRRAAECIILYPHPDRCMEGSREINDLESLSCQELVNKINTLGYYW